MSLKLFTTHDEISIRKNGGTIRSAQIENDSYIEEAFIPRNDWEKTSCDLSGAAFTIPDSICLVNLDAKIISIVKNLGISEVQSNEELQALISKRKAAYSLFLSSFKKFLHENMLISGDYNLHGIYVGGRNLLTSTIDFDRPPFKHTGLHIDTWERIPIEHLEKSPNRISFNLGKGHRYFLYIDLTISEIINNYLAPLGIINVQSKDEAAQLFLEKYPDYPVKSLKLDPFQGYIAPTENIIHDGSNIDSNEVDIQITVRGFIKPNGNI